jgi:formamidopyrimidine-DNA glycosylase
MVGGEQLRKIRLGTPFILRSVDPPISETFGKTVVQLRRIGKRVVFELEGDLYIVIHLMIAGRFHWKKPDAKLTGRISHAALDFPSGTLLLTEASSKKRASMHIIKGAAGLAQFDRGGLEVLEADEHSFKEALLRENRTLKRALTDPRLFSGIGNSYSDEILHHAKLSPLKLSTALTREEVSRLFNSTVIILTEWTDRLRSELAGSFPEKVTAFRDDMAVHGRFGKPCPECGTAVQRIVYAENECNYCPRCQTGGKMLSDRSLARLLKGDWPKTIDELEQGEQRQGGTQGMH